MPPKRHTSKSKASRKVASTSFASNAITSFEIDCISREDNNFPAAVSSTANEVSLAAKQQLGRTVFKSVSCTSTFFSDAHLSEAAASKGCGNGVSLAGQTLQALLNGTRSIHHAADGVLSIYQQGDPSAALCAVLNLVAKASGVPEVELEASALADGVDIVPLLEELYARVPEESAAYFLANKESRYRYFRRALSEFFVKLLQRAFSADVLLDAFFLPTLFRWLISMSESKARSFRHTATVAIEGIVQALNQLTMDMKTTISTTRLNREVHDLQAKLEDLTQWRDNFFSQALHQRFRDVAPEIRIGLFQSLKSWVLEAADEFMTNKYLRYFGMPLHDKRPELRAEALDMILQALARVPDAHSRMRLFLQYFANRLVEMSNDVDVRCTELAIRIAAMVVRGDCDAAEGDELFTNTMIDRVLLTLFDERPTVRTAAGILLRVFIHCRTTSEESEAAQVRVASELLCSFATTLRSQYGEAMPERYLVDALWSSEGPPALLVHYKPILDLATTATTQLDVVVGLGLLTAVLEKIDGKLSFGPLPKDDRRNASTSKITAAAREAANHLSRSIGEDMGAALNGIMEKHGGDQQVLYAVASAVAALDLRMFTSQRQVSTLSGLLMELRKATMRLGGRHPASSAEDIRDALVRAWHAVSSTAHPAQSVAQGHLQEMQKQVLQQLTHAEKAARGLSPRQRDKGNAELYQTWNRLSLISSLVPTVAQWDLIKGALHREVYVCNTLDASALQLIECLTHTATNSILHCLQQPQQQQPDSSEHATQVAAQISDLAKLFLRLFSITTQQPFTQTDSQSPPQRLCLPDSDPQFSQGYDDCTVRLNIKALTSFFDLAALPYYQVPSFEQLAFVKKFEEVFEVLCHCLRAAQGLLRTTVAQRTEDSAVTQTIAVAQKQCFQWEATQMRLVIGLARLILFKRLDFVLAPRFLAQWTLSSSKAVSDIFKGLFHALRDAAGESFQLEHDILLESYNRCAEVGATPISVEALYQTGSKLASMHFTATDRYHAACEQMILFGVDFAVSTDPLILQGLLPYCSKLRASDAVRLLRDTLAPRELFFNPTSPYVRSFITALRRAAKLDGEGSSVSMQAVGLKRSREVTLPQPEEEELLAHITRGAEGGKALQEASTCTSQSHPCLLEREAGFVGEGRTGQVSLAARVVSEEGCHASPEEGHNFLITDGNISVRPSPTELQGGPQATSLQRAVARARQRRPVVNLPNTQETAQSSLASAFENEVFIATQEF